MSQLKRKSEEEHSPARRSSDTLGIRHTDAECLVLRDQVFAGLSEDAKPIWLQMEQERKAHVENLQATIASLEQEHDQEIEILEERVDTLERRYNAEKARVNQFSIKFATEKEAKEKEYVQNLKSAWDQIRDERAKNEQLSKLVENLRAENEELKVDVEELQNGECDGCEKWEAEYEALQEENIELDSACEELNETNEQLITRKAHLAEELEEEKAETAHYKQKYEQALGANTNAVQLQQQLDYEKEVKQQLYDHLQTANATIQSLKEQLHTLQSQVDHDKETKEQLLVHVNAANASIQQFQAEAQQTINAKDQTLLQEQSKAVSLRVQLQAVTVELEREKKTRQEQAILTSQHTDAQVTELRQIIDQEKKTRQEQVTLTSQHTDAQVTELRQIIEQERQRSFDLSAVVAHLEAQLSTANDENSGLSGHLAALQQVTAKHQEKSTGLVAASLSVYERANQPEARVQTLETLLAAVSVPVPADVYERAKEPYARVQILETLLAAASVPLPAEKTKKKQKKAKKEVEKKQERFFMLPLCTFFDEVDEVDDEGFLPDAPPLEPSFSSSYPLPSSSSPYSASAAPSTLPSSPPASWFTTSGSLEPHSWSCN